MTQRSARHAVAVVIVLMGGAAHAAPPAAPVRRIVSLAPSITETLYVLGVGSDLVGVCAHCNYPEAAAGVPRVGGYLTPSVEAVLAARPDLVLAVPSPGNREAVRAVERAGVRVVVVQDRTLEDLWDAIRTIAEAVGRSEAGHALIDRIRHDLDLVSAAVARRPRRRVLLVVGRSPLIVVGGATLQDALIRIAGGDNVAADIGAAFPQIAVEVVVARAPAVILDAAMGSEAGGQHAFAEFPSIPAVRDGRIITLAPDAIFRSGPRVAEAARDLARAIHPGALDAGHE